MVLVEADLADVNCEAFLEAFERLKNSLDDLRFEHGFPVLDRDLDVIVALGDIMIPAPDALGNIDHGAIVDVCCVCLH